MSLATTCPTCQTVFRVVEDQLKVSEGWVRCGQCQQVFNALEGLFDLSAPRTTRSGALTWAPTEPVGFEHDPAPATPAIGLATVPRAATPSSVAPGTQSMADGAVVSEAMLRSSTAASREFFSVETTTFEAAEGMLPAGARLVDASSPQPAPARDDPGFEWAAMATAGPSVPTHPVDAGVNADGDAAPEDDSQNSRWAGLGDESLPAPSADSVTPAFVRDAERRERWQRPGVRLALSTSCGLLAIALSAQIGFHWRDRLAASKPALRPLLAATCGLVGCELQAPRVLDALVVDGTTVSRQGAQDAFRLSVQLRNRADHPVAVPHLELNLTDAQGRLILRRVLKPADFRIAEPSIAAQTESTWSLDFTSGQRRITGYTVAAFYP
jgi:predicted Zn finger-like uncharacterized protein